MTPKERAAFRWAARQAAIEGMRAYFEEQEALKEDLHELGPAHRYFTPRWPHHFQVLEEPWLPILSLRLADLRN